MIREFFSSSIEKVRESSFGSKLKASPYFATIVISFLIVAAGINIFIELSANVKAELMGGFDKNITDSILALRSPSLTEYFTFVTDVGDVQGYLVVVLLCSGLIFYVFRKWNYVVQVILVLFLATISNVILKRVFDRARPDIEHLVSVKTLSYPSGHAMSSMAFYGFLIYLVYKFQIPVWMKLILTSILLLLIISIGTSRIYLGVHFPSDVLGGWIAGGIWVFFCIVVFNLIETFRRDPLT